MKLYHITDNKQWSGTLSTGSYIPEDYSIDGFIHCSTASQVVNVAKRFYADRKDLIFLTIDSTLVFSPIVFENLEGGLELFPHIYGTLNIESVVKVSEFILTGSGDLTLPPGTLDT
jgi:uncharacterized protein (DUF952 family)